MDFRIRDIWEAYWNGFMGGLATGVLITSFFYILMEKLT